jgi:hypothetical protein
VCLTTAERNGFTRHSDGNGAVAGLQQSSRPCSQPTVGHLFRSLPVRGRKSLVRRLVAQRDDDGLPNPRTRPAPPWSHELVPTASVTRLGICRARRSGGPPIRPLFLPLCWLAISDHEASNSSCPVVLSCESDDSDDDDDRLAGSCLASANFYRVGSPDASALASHEPPNARSAAGARYPPPRRRKLMTTFEA